MAEETHIADITNLPNIIVEWRRLHDETSELRQQVRERSKRLKALEGVILRVMKSNNIGALDLKNSGGRLLYKKAKQQSSLCPKNIQKYIAECLNSNDEALRIMKFISEKREVSIKDKLAFENNIE